jgi:hypothetical protein
MSCYKFFVYVMNAMANFQKIQIFLNFRNAAAEMQPPIFLHTTQKCSNELSKTLNEPKTLGDRCRYITDISTVKKTQF